MDESDGTDAELLERLASGDQRAMAVVFDRHAPAVTRYAWAIAPSRMDVEEIVQDTFLTAWRKAAEVMIAEASLLPWLLVTCRNFGMNAVRKAARSRAEQFDDEARSAEPTSSENITTPRRLGTTCAGSSTRSNDSNRSTGRCASSAWSKVCPTPRRPSSSTSASAQSSNACPGAGPD